ncbi:Uncharacterised protein [uncultured archaeon]|nr:Uncharacterised protein [uncultured archaeon]
MIQVIVMGASKKDLSRRHAQLKARIAQLEVKARDDPAGKDKQLHEELAKLKKELTEN